MLMKRRLPLCAARLGNKHAFMTENNRGIILEKTSRAAVNTHPSPCFGHKASWQNLLRQGQEAADE
jgi:hypothetical protein